MQFSLYINIYNIPCIQMSSVHSIRQELSVRQLYSLPIEIMGLPQVSNAIRWQTIGMKELDMSIIDKWVIKRIITIQ